MVCQLCDYVPWGNLVDAHNLLVKPDKQLCMHVCMRESGVSEYRTPRHPDKKGGLCVLLTEQEKCQENLLWPSQFTAMDLLAYNTEVTNIHISENGIRREASVRHSACCRSESMRRPLRRTSSRNLGCSAVYRMLMWRGSSERVMCGGCRKGRSC
jgi:hypothetical protein